MEIQKLIQLLDEPEDKSWLRSWDIENVERAHANLVSLAAAGLTLDLLAVICDQLAEQLPKTSDPDMALNNLDRFIKASRNPLAMGALLERDPEALPPLLQILSTSQHLADLLVRDPEGFDLLRLTNGLPVARDVLMEEIVSEILATGDEQNAMAVLRRYKHRETLRIAYGDIVTGQRIATVTRQISFLADALCEAALQWALREQEERRGVPRLPNGERARVVILALGKLGGNELNYSSDIDLIFISDSGGTTDGGRPVSNQEFFERAARRFTKLMTETTESGVAWRVDLRLRPDGSQSPAVAPLEAALRYYDVSARTWERQAFVKARACAGDMSLGEYFLKQLEPWIYRRYLSRADITGIKALKRRIEHRAMREKGDARNVKTGHGGIRDIEFVIQFLQLLNGGDLPDIRTGNTLDAIAGLATVGCLTMEEQSLLEETYGFLRKLEHRLQIMFDLQTHTMPERDDELRRLAVRMGYKSVPHQSALDAFKQDIAAKTEWNRKILDHLLHDAFSDEGETAPEVDLVLDPAPDAGTVAEVLGRYNFTDIDAAYANLMTLADERIRFLSTRRCRHFLASIAPALLQAIAPTPDPDATLVSLSKVSDSLGGKGVLWELFSFNPPSLRLYVQLCASSPYLTGILMSHPGMIDELMDSLVLDKLPKYESLESSLAELCHHAEDVEPILHSFKNSNHLRVGVRDILGKEDIREIHIALSDIAEVCLNQIVRREYEQLTDKFGEPFAKGGSRDGELCELVILAMGKLGGREPNYHSDLDVVFLYDADGMTRHRGPGRNKKTTTNQHFFSQLGQRITKVVTRLGQYGRLYELDPRLRPTGKSGALAIPLAEFDRYFASGQGQLWERQALCKARPVTGSDRIRRLAMDSVRRAIRVQPWQPSDAAAIYDMRKRLEDTASKRNLKRGPGGTVDIEFLVQMLTLRYASESSDNVPPGTLDAIIVLHAAGKIEPDDAEWFTASYRFLRHIETGLRLMNTTARHDLPDDDAELKKLAHLLGQSSPRELLARCDQYTTENRVRFERCFGH